MPLVEKHVPGSFCWAELATTDAAAARSFYGDLLNWGFQDQETGGGFSYSTVKVQGHDAAGMFGLPSEHRAQGVPPHWRVYFTVKSSDESAAKTRELGGKVLAPPFDVSGVGRMAMLEDPTGAKFAIFQPSGHSGATIVNELGTPSWPELATRDTGKAESFYTQLLGWGTKKSSAAAMPYTEWQLGGQSIGGMIQMDDRWGAVPPHWMIYVMVSDCNAVAEKAAALGGMVCVPPTDIPNVGRFAVMNDPQGAVFSIIQLSAGQT